MPDFWEVFTDLCEQIHDGYNDSRKEDGHSSPCSSVHPPHT